MDNFDFVASTRIIDLSLSDENDLMKSRTYKNFPKNNPNHYI
jgi:hypothetical protein